MLQKLVKRAPARALKNRGSAAESRARWGKRKLKTVEDCTSPIGRVKRKFRATRNSEKERARTGATGRTKTSSSKRR